MDLHCIEQKLQRFLQCMKRKKSLRKKRLKKSNIEKSSIKKIVKRNGSSFQALQITNLILSHQQNEQHSKVKIYVTCLAMIIVVFLAFKNNKQNKEISQWREREKNGGKRACHR